MRACGRAQVPTNHAECGAIIVVVRRGDPVVGVLLMGAMHKRLGPMEKRGRRVRPEIITNHRRRDKITMKAGLSEL